MDKLTSMQVFVKAAELGSFASVAEALSLSPQMVAKHIQTLEEALGMRLINRTTRRQSMTDIGQAYYDRCKVILSEVDSADALALSMHQLPKGVLRVSAPVTFGAYSMAPFITRFLSTYPDMQIDLSLSDRYVDPVEDGFEAMIRIGELNDSSLIARPLIPYKLIVCASPDYLTRMGTPKTPQDLLSHNCLVYSQWATIINCRWLFNIDHQQAHIAVEGRLRCNNWKALQQAAIDGFGITQGPESILSADIKAGRLVRILSDFESASRPMHLVYPADRKPTTKLRSFIDAVLDEFA